jgi:sugar phosphate isomerase/epimerase
MANSLSRRGFFQGATAAAALGCCSRAFTQPARPYDEHLGLQTSTLSGPLERDPRLVLRQVADMGYRELELHRLEQLPSLAPLAASCGLRVVSSHIPAFYSAEHSWTQWMEAGVSTLPAGFDLEGIVATASAHKLRYLAYARSAPAEAYLSAEQCGFFCGLLNRVGRECRKAGIRFAYHNHFHEFARVGNGTFFDRLAEQCDPRHVAFEIDVCWAAHAGQDPAALIARLAGRVPLIHLKDRRAGVPVSTADAWPTENIFAEVGSGVLDIRGILLAAHASRVEHVFVEQDETAGDPLASVAKSCAYLTQLGL